MLNADKSKFLIGYEAEQLVKPKEFAARKNEPALEDRGFYLFAARAMELASADFGSAGGPHNVAVLAVTGADAKDRQGLLYVYFYPAQTKAGIYPLGGDAKYLVSPDGMKIIEKRQMHKTVAEALDLVRDLKLDLAVVNKDARPREGRQVNGAPDNVLFQDGDQIYDGVIVRLVPEI